jgi:DNA-binding Lrp family transcriptional regulator
MIGNKRAWIMVNENIAMLRDRPLGKALEAALEAKAVKASVFELFGLYDAVVEVEGESIEWIFNNVVVPIMDLPVVAGTTTYYSMEAWTRPGKLRAPFAYTLVGIIPKEKKAIQDHLSKIDEVQKIDVVSGPYDILVEITASSINDLVGVLVKMLSGQAGITRTNTLIVFRRE